MLVGFDANYSIRDLFFPQVGLENQTLGNLCRAGFWVDGRFAWLEDPAWERQLGYWRDTLVSDVTLTHPGLGISVHFEDFVDMVRDYLIRRVRVTSVNPVGGVRVFFHHDWYMRESDLGTTVLYEPEPRAVIAYKGDRWALAGGTCGGEFGVSSWATGKKGAGLAGTWVDAEDGELGRNPIDQGAVDSTIAFHLGSLGAGESHEMTHWLVFGKSLLDVTTYGQDLICARDPEPISSEPAPTGIAGRTRSIGTSKRRSASMSATSSGGAFSRCAPKSTTAEASSRPTTTTSPSSRATPTPTSGRATARWWRTSSTAPATRTSPGSSSSSASGW